MKHHIIYATCLPSKVHSQEVNEIYEALEFARLCFILSLSMFGWYAVI